MLIGDGATDVQDFQGWDPPHRTRPVSPLAAGWGGRVHVAQGRVCDTATVGRVAPLVVGGQPWGQQLPEVVAPGRLRGSGW